MEIVLKQKSSNATLLKIDLGEDGVATPSDLSTLVFPPVEGHKGLIVSGFPQYAVMAVGCHYKNNCKWIAVFDPKINPKSPSVVVVWSLDSDYRNGDVIPLESCGLDSPV